MISGTFSRREVSVSSGRRARGEPARSIRSLGVYTPGTEELGEYDKRVVENIALRPTCSESDRVDNAGEEDREDDPVLGLAVRL
jgi:hypothetical protein